MKKSKSLDGSSELKLNCTRIRKAINDLIFEPTHFKNRVLGGGATDSFRLFCKKPNPAPPPKKPLDLAVYVIIATHTFQRGEDSLTILK